MCTAVDIHFPEKLILLRLKSILTKNWTGMQISKERQLRCHLSMGDSQAETSDLTGQVTALKALSYPTITTVQHVLDKR
jgi:hypothetical protein